VHINAFIQKSHATELNAKKSHATELNAKKV